MIRRWLIISLTLALAAGTVLSLPAFWGRPVVGQKSTQVARHWLDCVFTASSALTGTGLSPHDIGDDFNFTGQALILGYIQAGGLAVLVAGSIVGWRFRRRFAWGSLAENASQSGPGRLILFVCLLTLLLEAAGAGAIYYSTEAGPDGPDRPLFTAVFHSVSAFCNTGLTVTRDSFVAQNGAWRLYAVLLPLMVLGSIGGPVLYELWRKLLNSQARCEPLSRETRVTLIGTGVLVLAGAAIIFFTESTPRWQLRNPREDTPGRLMIDDKPQEESIVFSADDSAAATRQRLRTMSPSHRAAAALFHSVSSRTTGFRMARLDEESVSPAGQAMMMVLMLIGGGLGGAAGGLRITIVAVLLGTLWGRRDQPASPPAGEFEASGGRASCPPSGQVPESPKPETTVAPIGESATLSGTMLRAAAAVAVAMFLIIGFCTLFLIYRESAAVEACAFEALSACTNTGLSAGLTRLLSPEGQVVIILAMLLGRIIPLAMLANHLKSSARHSKLS